MHYWPAKIVMFAPILFPSFHSKNVVSAPLDIEGRRSEQLLSKETVMQKQKQSYQMQFPKQPQKEVYTHCKACEIFSVSKIRRRECVPWNLGLILNCL